MVKINASGALRLLTNNHCNGTLPLDDVTMKDIHFKHREASPMCEDRFIQGPIALVNKVIFDSIDKSKILQACLRTEGAAGVSGLGAEELQRVLDFSISIARLTRIISTNKKADPESLEALLACRLISLDNETNRHWRSDTQNYRESRGKLFEK